MRTGFRNFSVFKTFLSKNSGVTELKKALELVLNDRKYISENLAEQLAAEIGSQQK